MYRYYKTSIQELNGVVLPNPEPDNWLGYRSGDKFFLKTTENIDAEEIDIDSVKNCSVNTELLRDQFA